MSRVMYAALLSALALTAAGCASSRASAPAESRDAVPAEASAHGRYEGLLATVPAPDDVKVYGEFNDWGLWQGTSYAGRDDLPPGFWVYASPNWYVWAKDNHPRPVLIYPVGAQGDGRSAPSPVILSPRLWVR